MKFLRVYISLTGILLLFGYAQVGFAQAEDTGFTAVSGTNQAVTDTRAKNNTAIAVAAGAGTVALFTIGLSATVRERRNS
jgi:hypothetical protein